MNSIVSVLIFLLFHDKGRRHRLPEAHVLTDGAFAPFQTIQSISTNKTRNNEIRRFRIHSYFPKRQCRARSVSDVIEETRAPSIAVFGYEEIILFSSISTFNYWSERRSRTVATVFKVSTRGNKNLYGAADTSSICPNGSKKMRDSFILNSTLDDKRLTPLTARELRILNEYRRCSVLRLN